MADLRPGGTLSGGLYARLNPYPAPRTNRRDAIPTNSSLPSAISAPRVFNWAGHLRNAGADLCAIVSSRRIIGPAYIDTWDVMANLGQGSTRSPKIMLGYSLSVIADQTDAALTALAAVTMFFEQDYVDDGGFAADGPAGLYQSIGGTNPPRQVKLGRAVQAPEFFLIAALKDDAGAGGFTLDFTLRVLENLDPELLADIVTG